MTYYITLHYSLSVAKNYGIIFYFLFPFFFADKYDVNNIQNRQSVEKEKNYKPNLASVFGRFPKRDSFPRKRPGYDRINYPGILYDELLHKTKGIVNFEFRILNKNMEQRILINFYIPASNFLF
jgi:hypothetical protein